MGKKHNHFRAHCCCSLKYKLAEYKIHVAADVGHKYHNHIRGLTSVIQLQILLVLSTNKKVYDAVNFHQSLKHLLKKSSSKVLLVLNVSDPFGPQARPCGLSRRQLQELQSWQSSLKDFDFVLEFSGAVHFLCFFFLQATELLRF